MRVLLRPVQLRHQVPHISSSLRVQACPLHCAQSRWQKNTNPTDKVIARQPQRDLIVREFDQVGSDVRTRRRFDPGAELREEAADVKARIDELEKELAILKQGPFARDSKFMRMLPSDEREKLLKALEEEGIFQGRDDSYAELDNLDEILDPEEEEGEEPQRKGKRRLAVTLRIPARQKAYVKHFNKALDQVVDDVSDPQKNLILWKWYLRCQQHVPGFSNVIPEDIWRTLWQSQTYPPVRPKHVIMLTMDMLSADVTPTSEQWVSYIEALLTERDAVTAAAAWEKQKAALSDSPIAGPNFWQLGVRLYASIGRPQKAQDIALRCLDSNSLVDARILVPVIEAWANSQSPAAAEKAWTCYLRLRTALEGQMEEETYELLSNSFLKAGKTDMALAVFKDLILTQNKSLPDSKVIYEKAAGRIHELQSQAVTEEEVNRISLAALLVFPKSFQNKFFFGSWIKKLIGQGELDAAAQVVEIMYERGIKLEAKHLNGLIGAWLREGSKAAREKAEQMAWAMIDARIAFVNARDHGSRKSGGPRMTPSADARGAHVRIPPFLRRAAPPATIETFSILLLHYTRRSDLEAAAQLTQTMTGPAKIMPNSFIMNHWLYAALRSSDLQGVWDKYSSLKAQIQPDLETFAALWDAGQVQYDKARAAHGKGFPTARVLFGEMASWVEQLSGRNAQRAHDEFSQELYNQIIRCFCLSADVHGTLCALHGLRDLFNGFPDENTTRMIAIQVSRLLPGLGLPVSRRRGVSRRKPPLQKDTLAKVMGLMETMAREHATRSNMDSNELETDSDVAKQFQLDVLTEFLLVILARITKETGDVENEAKTVARAMGVSLKGVDFGSLQRNGST